MNKIKYYNDKSSFIVPNYLENGISLFNFVLANECRYF